MYKCLRCGEKIPIKVAYFYSFLGLYLNYRCTKCNEKIIKRSHNIIVLCYLTILSAICLIFGLLFKPGWGIGIMFLSVFVIGPLYFKILLWAEKKSRKKEK